MTEGRYFLKYNIDMSIVIRFKQCLPSIIQSVEFTGREARQNNGLYVLHMIVKLAYRPLSNYASVSPNNNLKSRLRARKYIKCTKTWHAALTSGYCSRDLKRNSKVVYTTRLQFGISRKELTLS